MVRQIANTDAFSEWPAEYALQCNYILKNADQCCEAVRH